MSEVRRRTRGAPPGEAALTCKTANARALTLALPYSCYPNPRENQSRAGLPLPRCDGGDKPPNFTASLDEGPAAIVPNHDVDEVAGGLGVRGIPLKEDPVCPGREFRAR